MLTFGVDIAREGADKSVCYIREDWRCLEIAVWAKADTMESARRVQVLYVRYSPTLVTVDADGIGVGVFDRLREQGLPVSAFQGSKSTTAKDASGVLGFRNWRSYAWWRLRELLDPRNEHPVEIPENDDLVGDLCSPRWKVANGLVEVETKDKIKQRLGRSPDLGDAMAYAYFDRGGSGFESGYKLFVDADLSLKKAETMTEEQQLDALMWGRPTGNHDVFSW